MVSEEFLERLVEKGLVADLEEGGVVVVQDRVEALERVGMMVVEDIATLLAGGRPQRCVNPEAFR